MNLESLYVRTEERFNKPEPPEKTKVMGTLVATFLGSTSSNSTNIFTGLNVTNRAVRYYHCFHV